MVTSARKNPALASSFGVTVRKLRLSANVSQEALAALAGIDRAYMGRIERGQFMPSLDMVVRISQALAVPAGDLVDAAVEGCR
jgi:XRE family transcriptional regulator, regulator of sulfur utilization